MEGNWNNISKMSYTSTLNQWHHFQKKYPKDQLAKKKKKYAQGYWQYYNSKRVQTKQVSVSMGPQLNKLQ